MSFPGLKEFTAFRQPMPVLRASNRLLVVGPPAPLGLLEGSIRPQFRTIAEAMDFVPLPKKAADGTIVRAPPHDTWTIFVLPGTYFEEIRMKPNVILSSLYGSAVIFPPLGAWSSPDLSGRRAICYLNHNTSVTGLVFAKDRMQSTDYVFWAKDRYNVGKAKETVVEPAKDGEEERRFDVHFDMVGFGVTDVWIWPYPYGPPNLGKSLLIEGAWHTALFTNFGTSYSEASGYDIEIRGAPWGDAQVADCHFTNCFFDAMYISGGAGGCMLIEDLQDVHVRNSLLRIGMGHAQGVMPGACIEARGKTGTRIWLVNSALEAPGRASDRALYVHGSAACEFRGSTSDSYLGSPTALTFPAIGPLVVLPAPPPVPQQPPTPLESPPPEPPADPPEARP